MRVHGCVIRVKVWVRVPMPAHSWVSFASLAASVSTFLCAALWLQEVARIRAEEEAALAAASSVTSHVMTTDPAA